jgi:hypothetical protein
MKPILEICKFSVEILLLGCIVLLLYAIHLDLKSPLYQISGAGNNKAFVLDVQTGELWLRAPGLSVWCGDNDFPKETHTYDWELKTTSIPSDDKALKQQLAERLNSFDEQILEDVNDNNKK